MADDRKVIPFRYYPEELDKDFEELMPIQNYSTRKNKAIKQAIIIAAAYIRKNKKKLNIKGEAYCYGSVLEKSINKDLRGFLSKELSSWGK